MKSNSVKKNFIYQLVYDILIMILPFLTSPYIARVIGAEGLGIYSYHYSISYYFVLFSILGLRNYGNRTIAKCRDNKEELDSTFSNLLAVHILVSLICCVGYIAYLFVVNQNEKIYAAIMFIQVLSGLFDISWFYFGIEHFKLTVSINTVVKVVNVICVFVFVKNTKDLWIYCLIMALGALISQIALWFPLNKYVHLVRPQWQIMKTHIKPMLILFIPSIAVSLYKYMDKIMIGVLSNKIQLGFYENAEKVINIPTTIITSFGTVMLPKMSNLMSTKGKNEIGRYIKISMFYVMWLSYALTFGLASVATVFAPVFWGTDFYQSGLIIMGLAITIPFISFANVIRTQYLIPSSRDKEFMVSVVSGAVVNLIVNAILIPTKGSFGAMIGTIIAEVTVCAIQCWTVRKELQLFDLFKQSSPFVFFGILMFAVVFGMGRVLSCNVMTLLLQIAMGGLIYCAVSFVYLYHIKETTFLNIVNKFLDKKKYKS